MVEGHQVARTAAAHRATLAGRRFKAESPNGRFTSGAEAIHKKRLLDVQSVGKQLFYFFEGRGTKAEEKEEKQVVAVHFGMSGHARVATLSSEPDVTPTTRLRLCQIEEKEEEEREEEEKEEEEEEEEEEEDGKKSDPLTLHVACMTLLHSEDESLWREKRACLGPDPLRSDADAELVFEKMLSPRNKNKSIGLLLMSQDVISGVGNIYRAEICHLARVSLFCSLFSGERFFFLQREGEAREQKRQD